MSTDQSYLQLEELLHHMRLHTEQFKEVALLSQRGWPRDASCLSQYSSTAVFY